MSSEVVPQPNVVSRVVSLPLVSSTYGMVSSAYTHTKENHPYLRSLCEVAEKGVLAVTAVAMTSAKPILQKMEPQIAVANNYACMGLDKIEDKLPILYQPSDEIVSRAFEIVTGAKDTLKTTVTNAKELVGRTKEAMHEHVEMTKAAVSGSIRTVLGSRVVQTVNKGVDTALTKSESLIDHYLPLTEEELEAGNIEEFESGGQKPNYYVRLGSLSSKVRTRAFQQAVDRLRDVKSKSFDVISQLHATIDVMQFTRKNENGTNQKLQAAQEKLYQSWLEWRKSTLHEGEECASTEGVEFRTLAIARNLTKNLQTTCITLVSNLNILPHNLQEQAHNMSNLAGDLYQNFHLVSSVREMSDSVLGSMKGQLDKSKGFLDHMVEYVNNTPLWLIGQASPQFGVLPASPEGDKIRTM